MNKIEELLRSRNSFLQGTFVIFNYPFEVSFFTSYPSRKFQHMFGICYKLVIRVIRMFIEMVVALFELHIELIRCLVSLYIFLDILFCQTKI